MFPGFALSLAPMSYHRDRGAGAARVDEAVPDLAPARDQIQSILTSAELGRGSRSSFYHRRGSPSAVS